MQGAREGFNVSNEIRVFLCVRKTPAAASARLFRCRTAFLRGIPLRHFARYSAPACRIGIIRTSLGAILFGAFAQSELAGKYTIGGVASPQGKVRATLHSRKVLASKPAAPFPHKSCSLSTENSFCGDPSLRRFVGTPKQHHPKISCSEVRAVPRQPIFG